jgi:mediator of RNA polymerase II transcription subunit 22
MAGASKDKREIAITKDAQLKSYRNRLKKDIDALVVNFSEIIKLCKIEEESQVSRATQCEEDAFEMQVRAANMVRAGESLMKLISDLKQFLILNDFPTVNETIAANSKMFLEVQENCDRKLTTIRDELATDLFELEDEYYGSTYKI